MTGMFRGNTDPGSMGFSRGSCVYQPFRPNVSHSISYPLAILIQVNSDCGMPIFCSSNDGLCVGSASVVDCSFGGNRSRASTSCHTHMTMLRPASTFTRTSLPLLLVSIIRATMYRCPLVLLWYREINKGSITACSGGSSNFPPSPYLL